MSKEKERLNQIVFEVLKEKLDASDYYKFGVKYFGPFLYGYTNWLYNSIKRNNYKKVFFFSRDGYMMEKAFHFFNVKNDIQTQYVYFSRKSIRQALLCHCMTYQESLKFIPQDRFFTVEKILDYYGFSLNESERIAKKYQINVSDSYLASQLPKNQIIKNVYYSAKQIIDEKSFIQNKLLLAYIRQINMSGKCVIVDIGWHGNMQFYLEKFLKINHLDASLIGYYVGIDPILYLNGETNGYIYHKKNLKLRKSILCFLGGYEKLFQSCEGSTYGYMERNGEILPVLEDYEYRGDDKVISYINEWQSGAVFFISKVKDKIIKFSDDKIWAYSLIKFGKNPSNKDVKLFSFFYNADGGKSYFVSQKPLYDYSIKEFIYALSNSTWKTGFMKSVFKISFPYYIIYSLMRK